MYLRPNSSILAHEKAKGTAFVHFFCLNLEISTPWLLIKVGDSRPALSSFSEPSAVYTGSAKILSCYRRSHTTSLLPARTASGYQMAIAI